MTTNENSVQQQIMDKAYELFRAHPEWQIADLFDHLSYVQRVAVALGNLNYQVENGGFTQWYFNGYAEVHFDSLSRLDFDKEKYPALAEAIRLMRKAHVALEATEEMNREHHNYDEDEHETTDILGKCDDAYYKLVSLEDEMNDLVTILQQLETLREQTESK